MLKIAVCDDEEIFADRIKKLLEKQLINKGIEHKVDVYSSGIELAKLGDAISEYRIVFLDIDMEGMNGIQTAEVIRTYSDDIYIAFVTAYINYAPEGYRCNAIRYILKNSNQLAASIYECMDAILDKISSSHKTKTIDFCGGSCEVLVNQIMYIESNKHKLLFHIIGKDPEDYSIYSTLNDVEKEYIEADFLRVHQSYMVNMKYISKLVRYYVILENGERISIPKGRYREVADSYIAYRGKIIMGNSINSVIIITIEMITCRMLYESFVVRKKNITDKVYNMSMVLLIGVMFIISGLLRHIYQ